MKFQKARLFTREFAVSPFYQIPGTNTFVKFFYSGLPGERCFFCFQRDSFLRYGYFNLG